jgi:hypothetical protein
MLKDPYVEQKEPPQTSDKTLPASLLALSSCPRQPNRYTNHIRLHHILYNITMSPRDSPIKEKRKFWNPTILALPSWSNNQVRFVGVFPYKSLERRSILTQILL